MDCDAAMHRRRSIRLKGHDYSQAGVYFVTICTEDRACLFGEVVDGVMRLNDAGRIVENAWFDLPNHIDGLVLDAFVVMPNHVHGIVIIIDNLPTGSDPARADPTGAGFERAPTAVTNIPVGVDRTDLVGTGSKPAPTAVTNISVGVDRTDLVGAGSKPAPAATPPVRIGANTRHGLSEVVRQFKTFSARRVNDCRLMPGVPVWQRNYYEHIIRADGSLHRIRQYIADNPAHWSLDEENPDAGTNVSFTMNRRDFVLACAATTAGLPARELRIGISADAHYADFEARGSRHYRASLGRMREAVAAWNRARIDVAVELGDFVDTGAQPSAEVELAYLRAIEAEFARAGAVRCHVLGNHCVATLRKEQFLRAVRQPPAYWSFDRRGFHCVVLDACFRKDGVAYGEAPFEWTDSDIPQEERNWLAADLAAGRLPTIVFVHQRLDLPVGDHYAIWSSPEVRAILEGSGRVCAVLMGHSHANDMRTINGIAYLTFAAMVDTPDRNAFSVLRIDASGGLRLEGHGRHADHPLAVRPTLG